MTQDLPLGLDHPNALAAQEEFARKVEKRKRKGTWTGYYIYFAARTPQGVIGKFFGVSRTRVSNVYREDFQHQVFDGLDYRELCRMPEKSAPIPAPLDLSPGQATSDVNATNALTSRRLSRRMQRRLNLGPAGALIMRGQILRIQRVQNVRGT